MNRKMAISSSGLKWIAALTMLLDHVGNVFWQDMYAVMQRTFHVSWQEFYYLYSSVFLLGRIAFPIFAFQAAEGIFYTRRPRRYMGRLFLFGLLSQIPFQWMIEIITHRKPLFPLTNVMFTLLLAVLACECFRQMLSRGLPWSFCLAPAAMLALLAEYTGMDYGALGVLLVTALFLADSKKQKLTIIGVWAFFTYGTSLLDPQLYESFVLFDFLHPLLRTGYTCLCLPLLALYNGEKGRSFKYFFYLFYPVHLWLLMGIYLITH